MWLSSNFVTSCWKTALPPSSFHDLHLASHLDGLRLPSWFLPSLLLDQWQWTGGLWCLDMPRQHVWFCRCFTSLFKVVGWAKVLLMDWHGSWFYPSSSAVSLLLSWLCSHFRTLGKINRSLSRKGWKSGKLFSGVEISRHKSSRLFRAFEF